MSGQAFTDYYVTVVCEIRQDIFLVFQENNGVYALWGDFDRFTFFEDVQNGDMVTLDKYKSDMIR